MPKVVYRLPGEEEASWADLYNVMYRERNVYLMQEIQDEITNQITSILFFIHIENQEIKAQAQKKAQEQTQTQEQKKAQEQTQTQTQTQTQIETKPINLFINSTGGSIYSGLAIHGTMHFIETPVHTLCMGLAASMATVITLGGEPNHRLISPSSRMLIHQPATAYFDGQADDCFREAKEILRMRYVVTDLYRQQNGKSVDEITYHLERDLMLTPQEAINYGIVDRIAIELPELSLSYYNFDAYDDEVYWPETEDEDGAVRGDEDGAVRGDEDGAVRGDEYAYNRRKKEETNEPAKKSSTIPVLPTVNPTNTYTKVNSKK